MTVRKDPLGVQAVIILYYPELSQLKESINALLNQVDHIFLIDNTGAQLAYNNLLDGIDDLVTYYYAGENLGVARAQNKGINFALSNGAEYILIMDQDSLASDNMVKTLTSTFDFLAGINISIAVIGPQPINIQTQSAYEPRIRKWRPFVSQAPKVLEVSEIISSGSLIPRAAIAEVGYMDEYLFIDGVDHEWCWRAKKLGYKCAMTLETSLSHMLGEGDRKLLGVRVAITSPVRLFYQIRNYFYLCKKEYVPLYWKLNNGFKYLVKAIYYPVCVSPRSLYVKNIYNGVMAALNSNN